DGREILRAVSRRVPITLAAVLSFSFLALAQVPTPTRGSATRRRPSPTPTAAPTAPPTITPTAAPTVRPTVRPATTARVGLFTYDPTTPLDVRTSSARSALGVQQIELSYASPKKGRVPATLVVPPGSGPFAALVFVHPAGPNGRRDYFLSEALELARAG